MDEPRTDAPEFELSATPADASDALQLDPSDSVSGFEMDLSDPKAKPRVPAKPPKKPTQKDNDSVLAALLGKPLPTKGTAESASPAPKATVPVSILAAMLGKPAAAATESVKPPLKPAEPVETLAHKVVEIPAAPPAPVIQELEVPRVVEVQAVVPTATEIPVMIAREPLAEEIEVVPERIEVVDEPLTLSSEHEALFQVPEPPPLRLYVEPTHVEEVVEQEEDFGPDSYPIGIPFTPSEPIDEEEPVAEADPIEVAEAPVGTFAITEPIVEVKAEVPPARQRVTEVAAVEEQTPSLEDAFAVERNSYSIQAPIPQVDGPRAATGAWWTLPLMFAGIAIVACAVLVPAVDENRRAMYELAKIDRDVAYFQKQSDVNKDFLDRVSNDPTLAERLALRQLHMTRADTHLVPMPTKNDPFNRSPFALVSVDPPPTLEPYHPVGGFLSEWFLNLRWQIYLSGIGLLLAAAGVIFGGGEPSVEGRLSNVEG